MNAKTSPKDFFLHLGAVVALYVAAIALMDLGFGVINKAFPDALSNYVSPSSVIWPISLLIVLAPILYVFEWLILRDIRTMPDKAGLWVRRWRIYLTLFLTIAAMAGDVIALINTYLNGEVTTRFILKVLIVLVVSALIFAYYLLSRRNGSSEGSRGHSRWLAVLGIVLALAAIVGGFIIVGSPAQQRALRFDGQRINDLTNIQYQIVDYWQRVQALPASLTTLNDPLQNYVLPLDPETGAAYEYDQKSPTSFALCATFDTMAQPAATNPVPNIYPIGSRVQSWAHPAGKFCFERTIDPKQYPAIPKVL